MAPVLYNRSERLASLVVLNFGEHMTLTVVIAVRVVIDYVGTAIDALDPIVSLTGSQP